MFLFSTEMLMFQISLVYKKKKERKKKLEEKKKFKQKKILHKGRKGKKNEYRGFAYDASDTAHINKQKKEENS